MRELGWIGRLACVVMFAGCGDSGMTAVPDLASSPANDLSTPAPDLSGAAVDQATSTDLSPMGCQSDADCMGATPRCDKSNASCVACLPDMDNCPSGMVCTKTNGAYACAMGCKADADCKAMGAPTSACCNQVCIDTASDGANCGMCGKSCNGKNCCASACIDTMGDANNCGGCGMVCQLAGASATCGAGKCAIGSCTPGFGDCDKMAANGCETAITGDVNNCGGCGVVCTTANATPSCAMSGGDGGVSACAIGACTQGFADCDGVVANGCEVNVMMDAKNCGGCNMACAEVANGVGSCANGGCGIASCNAGFADCDKNSANGCEVDIATDVKNCGACNSICAMVPNGTPACVAGMCGVATCGANFQDCDKNPANGCEANITSDPKNCGACGVVCPMGVDCNAGACQNFASTGAEGPFNPMSDVTLSPGIHNYTTIVVPANVTVYTTGTGVLELRATGEVQIAGAIDVSGGAGGTQTSKSCTDNASGSGGGQTGNPSPGLSGNLQASAKPGPAGLGGTGSSGLSGLSVHMPSVGGGGGNFGGGGGGGYKCGGGGGGGGGGFAGGGGGFGYTSCECQRTSLGDVGGSGGGAGGGAGALTVGDSGKGGSAGGKPYDGQDGDARGAVTAGCGYKVAGGGGGGGGSIGAPASMDLAVASTFQPGSAGGGGGGDEGAGGGGAGGALRISSPLSITLGALANLAANGGAGGTMRCGGGPGGGGSGGVVYLYSPSLHVAMGAVISAIGGKGGRVAGAGGLGRIRIAAGNDCVIVGTVNPPPVNGCAAGSAPGKSFVSVWPQ